MSLINKNPKQIKAVVGLLSVIVAIVALLWTKQANEPTKPKSQPAETISDYDDRFTAQKNSIVYDSKAGLEWFAGHDKDTNWDEAKKWVESLEVDGGGWRMPTREELKSLYKKGKGERNMTPLLKTTGWYIWSGETKKGSSSVWVFYVDSGRYYLTLSYGSNSARVFAVRSRR